jgi:hypothetical protein
MTHRGIFIKTHHLSSTLLPTQGRRGEAGCKGKTMGWMAARQPGPFRFQIEQQQHFDFAVVSPHFFETDDNVLTFS